MFLTSLFCTLSLLIFGFQVYNSKVRHHTSRGNLSLPYFERPLTSSTLSIWYRLGNLNTTRFHHIQNKRGRRARFFSSRIGYYSNSNATFQFERISVSGDVSPNPGPTTDSTRQATQSSRHELKCLYFNSRSVVNKTRELEVIASSKQYDLIAFTETWLNDSISNNELLPSNKYYIHRRDREVPSRGGGVMLAVGSTLQSVRRTDLETNAEILVCEIRPEAKKKFLCVVFYRPPSSKSEYMNCFKNFLRKASKTHISQLVILGDFNFPDINWSTGTNSTLLSISKTASEREKCDKAAGLATKMTEFKTFFGLHFAMNLFCVCEQLATTMQTKGILAQTVMVGVRALKDNLQLQRDSYNVFFDQTQEKGDALGMVKAYMSSIGVCYRTVTVRNLKCRWLRLYPDGYYIRFISLSNNKSSPCIC